MTEGPKLNGRFPGRLAPALVLVALSGGAFAQGEKPKVQTKPGGPAATISPAPRPGAAASGDGGRVRASPRARRLASERGIDLSAVRGSLLATRGKFSP